MLLANKISEARGRGFCSTAGETCEFGAACAVAVVASAATEGPSAFIFAARLSVCYDSTCIERSSRLFGKVTVGGYTNTDFLISESVF